MATELPPPPKKKAAILENLNKGLMSDRAKMRYLYYGVYKILNRHANVLLT